ncbi:MAG TPA: hypothetical protein VGK89_01560 [Candidatus Eisenbacteria bacterium]
MSRLRAAAAAPPAPPPAKRSSAPLFLLVAGLVALTRLPFLGPGFGADPDAWRVAWAARVLATTGRYEASRFPGYPLQEMLSALIVRGGPLALNGASALLSAIGAGCFALALRRLGSRDAAIAALALASTPAVHLASLTAMDYAWALGFALAALALALGGRAALAGVLAGLAIGCRITSAGFLAPLALAFAHVVPPGSRLKAIARFGAAAIAVAVLAWLPVMLTYGAGFLRFYESGTPRLLYVIKNASVDLWGIPGTVALAAAVGALLVRGARVPRETSAPGAPRLTAAWASGIAIYALAYLRLPIKAFYLIPVVPFALLLLAQRLPRPAFVAVCVALVASPWILEVSQPGRLDSPGWTTGTVRLEAGGRPWVLDLLHGPVLVDHARRERGMRYVDRALEAARRLPGESVVVAWDWLPQIRVRLGGKRDGRVEYVYRLTAAELAELRSRGAGLYDLAGAEEENVKVDGVSLRENGSRPLVEVP